MKKSRVRKQALVKKLIAKNFTFISEEKFFNSRYFTVQFDPKRIMYST